MSCEQASSWQQQQIIKANEQPQQPLSYNTNSDFDSWSTTSASYTLSEPNSFLGPTGIQQQPQSNKAEQSKKYTSQSGTPDEQSRQQKSQKHQPVIRRVSSNSSTSSSSSFTQEDIQEGGAPLPIVMQNICSEHAHNKTGERRTKHSVPTNSSSFSIPAHHSQKQTHVISKISSFETLPSDGGTSGSSGCNIVYESSNSNTSPNKGSDSSDSGKKLLHDNKSGAGVGSSDVDKWFHLEKTNVPEAITKNSHKFLSARDVKPLNNNTKNETSGIESTKRIDLARKNTNESLVSDGSKGITCSNNGGAKKKN